jgi:hypothetical protein
MQTIDGAEDETGGAPTMTDLDVHPVTKSDVEPDSSPTLGLEVGRTLRDVLLVLLVAPAIGLVLVVTAQLVPDRLVVDRLVDGQATYDVASSDYPASGYGNFVDKFSECGTFTIGVSEPTPQNALQSAIRSYLPSPGCAPLSGVLANKDPAKPVVDGVWYFRYWHGSTTIIRPALLFTPMGGVRAIVALLLIASAVGLVMLVRRWFGSLAAVALLAPFLLATEFVELPQSIPHAVAFAAALASADLGVRYFARDMSGRRAIVAAVAAGAAVQFFDILIVPPVAWSLMVCLVGAVAFASTRSYWRGLAMGAFAAVGWIVGYASMWVAKWILAMPFEGVSHVIDDVRGATTLRLGGEATDVDTSFGAAFVRNIDFWIDRPLGRVMTFMAAVLVVYAFIRRRRRALEWVIATALVPCLIAVGWYLLLSNHSYVHVWMVYRAIPVALGIVSFASMCSLVNHRPPVRDEAPTVEEPSVNGHPVVAAAEPENGSRARESAPAPS